MRLLTFASGYLVAIRLDGSAEARLTEGVCDDGFPNWTR